MGQGADSPVSRRRRTQRRLDATPIVVAIVAAGALAGAGFVYSRRADETHVRDRTAEPTSGNDDRSAAQLSNAAPPPGATPLPPEARNAPRGTPPRPAPWIEAPQPRQPAVPDDRTPSQPAEESDVAENAPEIDAPTTPTEPESAEPPSNAPPPAETKRGVVGQDEWDRRVAAIETSSSTTVDRVRRLRALAASVDIENRCKILDVRPEWVGGGESVVLVCCGVWGGKGPRFEIPRNERDLAAAWSRWDRISWRTRASVEDDGRITAEPVFSGLADLKRAPDPGVEPFPLRKGTGGPAALTAWLKEFAKADYRGDTRTKERLWEAGSGRTWLLPATLSHVGEGRARGVLDADVYVDAVFTTTRRGAEPDFGVRYDARGERAGQRWGYDRKDQIEFEVPDPQLAAMLRVGSRVEVALDLVAGRSGSATNGIHPAAIRVRRLRK